MPGSNRGFTVAHQRVCVDVNLAQHELSGYCELSIVPSTATLSTIALDARQIEITKAEINGLDSFFVHRDLIKTPPKCSPSWTVAEHTLYREKLDALLAEENNGDLFIELPKTLQIVEQDAAATVFVSHTTQEKTYEPLTVRVYFTVKGSTAGLQFYGGAQSGIPPTEWHAYTTHSPLGQSSSTWMPCVDAFACLCTWEFEFAVPRTIKHLSENQHQHENEDCEMPDEGKSSDESENDEDENENDTLDNEILVICSNNSPNEVAHHSNSAKKLVRFDMFTPVFSQHVGFVIGPLVKTQMSSASGDENDVGTSGASGIPFCVFALPSKTALVENTCYIFSKAMEFFTRDFGSFPFGSYSLCFVADLPFNSVDAAALSICSDKLLFPETVVEPIFANTEPLIRCLSAQWCGVNIVQMSLNDLWITEGIALYMTHLFIRKLMGNNEYRFRMRSYADEITRQDIGRPPLGDPQFRQPVCPDDLEFLRLKAPMVLYILNRRMTKTDRSLGLSRVIPKLLLQSMSGDLNAKLSTAHFMKICEKVAHHRLDAFFDEWVYGTGYPIFRVTQRFNKKRMFIEMGINQVQSRELPLAELKEEQFLDKAMEEMVRQKLERDYEPAQVFTGPMTIRIHEADGTPYEHVVFLKNSFTKLDIQYNTKYKRLKRNQKFRSGNEEETSSGLIHCLGDVLMRDQDIEQWKLCDWGQDDEEYMFNEAFEWIRVDSDFEWIGKLFVGQPDYMYASQLQQDRDVVAQYEAVQFFASQAPHAIYSTILLRTLLDERYFHGIRVHAAYGLVSCACEQLNYLGKDHLLGAFAKLFCFPDSLVPRANDFRDFAQYFVQKAIVAALGYIRDANGQCPVQIRQFLLDLMRYNENSGNPYSDSYYIATLMTSLVTAAKPLGNSPALDVSDSESCDFLTQAVAEIDKNLRLDKWLPSYNHVVSLAALRQDEALVLAGLGKARLTYLLQLMHDSNAVSVRCCAAQMLLTLGGFRDQAVVKYVFHLILNDKSLALKYGLLQALAAAIGHVALFGEPDATGQLGKSSRHETLARQQMGSALELLHESDLAKRSWLQKELWNAIKSNKTNAYQKRVLLDLCTALYSEHPVVEAADPKVYRVSARAKNGIVSIRYRNVTKSEHHQQVKEEDKKVPRISIKLAQKPLKISLKEKPSEPKIPALKLRLRPSI